MSRVWLPENLIKLIKDNYQEKKVGFESGHFCTFAETLIAEITKTKQASILVLCLDN